MSKCQSLELIGQRDIDIREKDGVIQSYHYKTDGELMNPGS